MLQKTPNTADGTVEVTFSLVADGHVLPVSLAGDFNQWEEGRLALRPQPPDRLVVTVSLPAGQRYEFRYHDVQGRWFNDPAADDYCTNEWGGMNGVLFT